MPQIFAVVLDMDGTLLDSNDAHARAYCRAVEEHGFERSFTQVRRLIGMGADKLLPTLVGIEENSPEGKEIAQRKREIFMSDYLNDLRPFPGAAELVRRLKREGFRLVVASSAKSEDLEIFLDRVGIADIVENFTSSSEADESKPAPDVIQVALRKLGLKAQEAVMIGDTPYDVEAAQRAGVSCIAFRSGGWLDADLAGASEIYEGPQDLLNNLSRSALLSRSQQRQRL